MDACALFRIYLTSLACSVYNIFDETDGSRVLLS